MLNELQVLNALREKLIAFKIGLHSSGYIFEDALTSLTRRIIPATLMQPEMLHRILDNLKLDFMREATPRPELLTYYGFDLVDFTMITKTRINLLGNIPFHHTSRLYHVNLAVALTQPINDRVKATQYLLRKPHFLISENRDYFAELSEVKIIAHCVGTNHLKLCLSSLSMFKTRAYLSSIFLSLLRAALKLCTQEVFITPKEPTADHLYDSLYLFIGYGYIVSLQVVQFYQ